MTKIKVNNVLTRCKAAFQGFTIMSDDYREGNCRCFKQSLGDKTDAMVD